MVSLFGAAYTAPKKAPQVYTDLGLQKTVLNPLANGKIQGFFNAFECFTSTFQSRQILFQGLFKTVLYIQVLFKPVRTLKYLTSLKKNSDHFLSFSRASLKAPLKNPDCKRVSKRKIRHVAEKYLILVHVT